MTCHSSCCLHFSQSLETTRADQKSNTKAASGLDCAERILPINLPLEQHSRVWPFIPQHPPPTPARCFTQGWTPRQGVTSETHHPHLGADDFTLDPNSLCTGTSKPSRAAPSQLVSSDLLVQDTVPPRVATARQGQSSHSCSHCHFKLLHPLPLHLLRLAEELEALLSLEVDEVEAVRPLREKTGELMGPRCSQRPSSKTHCAFIQAS